MKIVYPCAESLYFYKYVKQIALELWAEVSLEIEPNSPEASSKRNEEITPLVASTATRESPSGKNLSTFVAP